MLSTRYSPSVALVMVLIVYSAGVAVGDEALIDEVEKVLGGGTAAEADGVGAGVDAHATSVLSKTNTIAR